MNGPLLLLAALAIGAAYVLGWRAGLAQARDEIIKLATEPRRTGRILHGDAEGDD